MHFQPDGRIAGQGRHAHHDTVALPGRREPGGRRAGGAYAAGRRQRELRWSVLAALLPANLRPVPAIPASRPTNSDSG